MARLTVADRRALPASDFADPANRAYPVPDASHARDALSRASEFGTAELKRAVREKVYRKFPDIKQGD